MLWVLVSLIEFREEEKTYIWFDEVDLSDPTSFLLILFSNEYSIPANVVKLLLMIDLRQFSWLKGESWYDNGTTSVMIWSYDSISVLKVFYIWFLNSNLSISWICLYFFFIESTWFPSISWCGISIRSLVAVNPSIWDPPLPPEIIKTPNIIMEIKRNIFNWELSS